MGDIEHCGAISRQGNVCARDKGHEGCHEVYVDGDGRRWWGEMDAAGLAEQLRGAVEALEHAAEYLSIIDTAKGQSAITGIIRDALPSGGDMHPELRKQ